jgi:hypothetical protein
MLLCQGFQHFLVADSPADLLPAAPVKSRFVTIDSGHSCLLFRRMVTAKLRCYSQAQLTRTWLAYAAMVLTLVRELRVDFRNR